MHNPIVQASLFALATGLSAPAFAQVTPVDPAPAHDQAAAAADKDESIYVVQRRAYSKSGKFEVTPLFYTSLNNKFVGHYGPALSAAYHLRENLAIELMSSIPYAMAAFYSGLVVEVYDYEQLTPEVVDLKLMDYFGAMSIAFSALYGKLELYGLLIDYDFFATAGFGLVSTVETCPVNSPGCSKDKYSIGRGLKSPDDPSDRYKLAGNLGGGMRLFFTDWLGLRLEIRDIVYSDRAADAGEVTTDIRSNVLFSIGVSFLL